MSDLYKRIEALCKEHKMNVTEMCRATGSPRGSLSDLKAGRITRLNTTTLGKIAAYFNVSIDYLLGLDCERQASEERDQDVFDDQSDGGTDDGTEKRIKKLEAAVFFILGLFLGHIVAGLLGAILFG